MGTLYITSVAPLAAADDDNVSLSQTAAAAQYLVVNGAGAAGTFIANSICASQSPAGAVDLTINGTLATTNSVAGYGGTAAAGAATVRFSTPQRIYITTAGNSSARTITIVGTVQTPGTFGPGAVITETFSAPNTNTRASTNLYSTIISIAISGASTGALTVGHSGTATLDVPRRIIITSGGDDSLITFTLTGTDWGNNVQSEVIQGVSGAAASSKLSYKTVTSILTSAAAASTLVVGTNAFADSPWVRFSNFGANAQVAIQVDGATNATWTIQQTMNDPNMQSNQSPTPTYQWSKSAVKWVNHPDSALVNSSVATGVQGSYGYTPIWAKMVVERTGAMTGSPTAEFAQSWN